MHILAARTDYSVLLGFGIMAGILVAYLLPSLISALRHLPNTGSILIVNLLLGWTFFGWVWALAMACRSKPRRPPKRRVAATPPYRQHHPARR